jgi:adenylate cyclase
MSGDAEQEYLSDGIAEDIITELSRFSELFVIARNSSFAFKGQAVDIKDAARQLGVQYVVEGSVRKAGNRVRVTAQLIDALGGAHIWADKYDRQLEDIFEVQDDVVRAIVAVLPGRIAKAGAEQLRHKPTSNMSAFDYLLRGNHALARGGNSIKQAIGFYNKAIEIDPDCAAAYAGIAIAEGMSVWDLSTYDDNPLDRAYEFGKKAIELDPNDYRSQCAFGEALRQLGNHGVARQHLERALSLNPNSTQVLGCWAMLLAYTGDPQGGVDTYFRAIKLDPFSEEHVRKEVLAEAYYMLRQYEQSNAVLQSMLKLPIFYVHQQIAINYAQLGDMAACERHMAKHRAELPATYDEKLLFESHLLLCERQEDKDHWREGYRLTGMDV